MTHPVRRPPNPSLSPSPVLLPSSLQILDLSLLDLVPTLRGFLRTIMWAIESWQGSNRTDPDMTVLQRNLLQGVSWKVTSSLSFPHPVPTYASTSLPAPVVSRRAHRARGRPRFWGVFRAGRRVDGPRTRSVKRRGGESKRRPVHPPRTRVRVPIALLPSDLGKLSAKVGARRSFPRTTPDPILWG